MYLARRVLGKGEWDVNLVQSSGYSEDDLKPIFKLMVDYLARPVPRSVLTYVQYAREQYLQIATSSKWAHEHVNFYGIDISIPFELAKYEAEE
ncbi:hypothetical protein IFR05_017321 [Cadophora sp. M221]|nr:hypothetical protein IFR05_017321 [Cadophora sp. M221]